MAASSWLYVPFGHTARTIRSTGSTRPHGPQMERTGNRRSPSLPRTPAAGGHSVLRTAGRLGPADTPANPTRKRAGNPLQGTPSAYASTHSTKRISPLAGDEEKGLYLRGHAHAEPAGREDGRATSAETKQRPQPRERPPAMGRAGRKCRAAATPAAPAKSGQGRPQTARPQRAQANGRTSKAG